MGYISVEEMKNLVEIDRIAQLSNDDTGLENVDATINEVIYDAQSMIDSYISSRYTVPLADPVARVVRDNAGAIAIYLLHKRRPWTISEQIRQAYEDAIAWCKDVAKKVADIPGLAEGGVMATGAYFGGQTRVTQSISHDNTTDMMGGF